MADSNPTHEIESSDSDDHFSDAHSGLDHSGATSPVVPLTRVEKVDDEAIHGEVPGTHTYNMRRSDAEPYEVAVLRDPDDLGPGASGGQTPTPGGHPIPKTVLEKVDASLSHGEIPGTLAHRQRAKDAVPDIVVQASNRGSTDGSGPGDLSAVVTKGEQDFKRTEDEPDLSEEAKDALGSPTSHGLKSAVVTRSRRTSSGASRRSMKDKQNEGEVAEGVFGDDFDDFEEGEEDADFDDFDDGFQEAEPIQSQSTPPTFSFPVLNFSSLDSSEALAAATEPHLNTLFPPTSLPASPLSTSSSSPPTFLTPRSASLWSQLVAPPPLQPPNWIRSRIRRLFLVSLGVPVDLDEILPASKQKKLILPSSSLHPYSTSPRTSTDSRPLTRLKQSDANSSSTSLDSQGKPRRRKGPPPAPSLDLVAARQLCSVTDEARGGLTMAELKDHVKRLEVMQGTAAEALDYWTRKTDETLGDREAFEGVIENLVKHARKVRK